jgi:hypothetical protein
MNRHGRDRSSPGAAGPATVGPLTRRQLLLGAGGAAAVAAAGGVLAAELTNGGPAVRPIRSFLVPRAGRAHAFHSRPDLRPPAVTLTAGESLGLSGDDAAAALLFLTPAAEHLWVHFSQFGSLIVDRDGEPVWFWPAGRNKLTTNLVVAQYRGEPVLTWWEGRFTKTGYGIGEAVIMDRSYRELARVRAANGRHMDLHEFVLTPEGTALFTCYPETVQADLSLMGGPRDGHVLASVIQEVDVASGRLLLEWRGLDHVPVTDSYKPLGGLYDYLHANSIALTPDGNLLVSARHTWTLYKLERHTGRVLWRLGGKRSHFTLGPHARFAWQHDARQPSDGRVTLFDNGSDGSTRVEHQSRGLVLAVDESRRTVDLEHAYTNPKPLQATALGSLQILPDGNALVGWGTAPYTSEFDRDGSLIADYRMPFGLDSYRASSSRWSATPVDPPAIGVRRDSLTGAKLVYASWNGATDVAGWLVHAGPDTARLEPVGIARRHGFETMIPLDPRLRYASVTALDASNGRLGRSRTLRL